ncbi:unnamed protein product [Linum tenue]|nr:unnamed protein product [Linum tenue]CAI0550131.1 unnamed protein product [Linum tenue]
MQAAAKQGTSSTPPRNSGNCNVSSSPSASGPTKKQRISIRGGLISRKEAPIQAALSIDELKLKQAEESLRTVMYLSCWGPNS